MSLFEYGDESFMLLSLQQAEYASQSGEVPVGGVFVCNNEVMARGHNMVKRLNDTTAHTEMQLITCATDFIGSR